MPERSPAERARLRDILEGNEDRNKDWTEEEFEHWMIWERLGLKTRKQRRRDLKRMAIHGVHPVKIHGTRFEIVDTFTEFSTYRELVERVGAPGIRNDYKAIKTLGKYRGIPLTAWRRPPPIVRRPHADMPSPEMIRALLRSKFAPDPAHSYEHHLVQYILAWDFFFGPRFPSEFVAMLVDDWRPATHSLWWRMTKMEGESHQVVIEPRWMCCGRNFPSLHNYVHKWRPKVDVGGTDAMLLDPNGEPFKSPEALKAWMDERVKPVAEKLGFGERFERYHGYLGRTWCAQARLIRWDRNFGRVAQWLGHADGDQVIARYGRDVEVNAAIHGDHWLERTFLPQRTAKGAKTPRPAQSSLDGKMLPPGFEPGSEPREGPILGH